MKSATILIIAIITVSCQQNEKQLLTIQSEKILDSLPSGSGMIIKNNIAFIVSDDGTGIYQLNLSNFRQNKIPITGLPFDEYREPKPVKHDFESICLANWNGIEYFIAFGSGSNSVSRDSMLIMNTSFLRIKK